MSAEPQVGVGIVGYGLMGRLHAYGYAAAPRIRELPCRPRPVLMSGRDGEALAHAARSYDVPRTTHDWQELVTAPEVDVVDVCTPPGTHAEIIAAAARAGKAVICEKPLATSYAAGAEALASVRQAGVLNAIGFNYRRLPAIALMRRMIVAGEIGEPMLLRATWLSDEFLDPATPFDWRFERGMGGTTIADLGAHLIDLALWMVGEIESVSGQSHRFTEERPTPAGGSARVDVDEASAALVEFASGARGVFEMARTCARRPCDFGMEVNGTEGTLRFDYPRLNELLYGDGTEGGELYGMRRIRAEHESHPYAAGWWPIGQGVGYDASFANQAADLFEAWPTGPWDPDLEQALRVQAVCEAIERAATERRWVDLAEVTAA